MSIQVCNLLIVSNKTCSDHYVYCRHEKPTDPDDPLSDQNIKDRYYGINDPVADKLLRRASEAMEQEAVKAPEDRTITTLYIGGLGDVVGEEDLRWVDCFLG